MPYVQGQEWYRIPSYFPPIPAEQNSELLFPEPSLVAKGSEQQWIDFDDVTRKSELERIYPSWIGWTNMAALLIAILGVLTLVFSLLFHNSVAFLIGAILFTIGLMTFLSVARIAARIRFGAARHSPIS